MISVIRAFNKNLFLDLLILTFAVIGVFRTAVDGILFLERLLR